MSLHKSRGFQTGLGSRWVSFSPNGPSYWGKADDISLLTGSHQLTTHHSHGNQERVAWGLFFFAPHLLLLTSVRLLLQSFHWLKCQLKLTIYHPPLLQTRHSQIQISEQMLICRRLVIYGVKMHLWCYPEWLRVKPNEIFILQRVHNIFDLSRMVNLPLCVKVIVPYSIFHHKGFISITKLKTCCNDCVSQHDWTSMKILLDFLAMLQ